MAKNAEDRYQSALGLKHDLQQCLDQWTVTGRVVEFELGQRDVCDRFLIPEKLYGRQADVDRLIEAFERVSQGASELMLVAGFSGIGKTAVINEVHKPITQRKGYFIKGKFDQLNRNIPFSAFVQAFRQLMGQLLGESEIVLENWKTKILTAVGEQGQVLIEVIPELALILGPQPAVPALSGTAVQNRFNRLFGKFIQVFTTAEHPLVIFLDDVQWIDLSSLTLFQRLVEQGSGYLLLLGAYRDNEVSAAHPLMRTLDDIQTISATVQTLILKALKQDDINQLVAESLHCAREICSPLTQLVYQKTQGNPFFATQFLQGLQADGWINFDADVGHWQCDLSQLRSLALTDDVVEFMVGRLQQCSQTTQKALAIAACLGNQFALETLSIVCEQSPDQLAQALWPALQSGLIIPEAEAYKFFQSSGDSPITTQLENYEVGVGYRFLHDRVQQAAYALIPESQKQQTHYQIGRLFLEHMPPEQQEESLFEIVNQLNMGRDHITSRDEKHQLISFNLRAGIKAKSATAYESALGYFDIAIDLLSPDGWQQNYPLALALHENAAEAAYLAGDGASMEARVEVVTVQAKTSLDTVNTLQVKMQYCVGENQPLASISIARSLLQDLGFVLPDSTNLEDIQQALQVFKQLAEQFSFDEIIALPVITNPEKLAIVSTLILVLTPLMITDPNLFLLVGLLTTQFSLEEGNSPYAPYGYSLYAILLKKLDQDINSAYEWGNLAVKLLHTPNPKCLENRAYHTIAAFITHEKQHVSETVNTFQQAYTSGVENGDFEFSGYSLYLNCYNLYFLGQELSTVQQNILTTTEALSSIGQNLPVAWSKCFYQTVIELSGAEDESHGLAGEVYDAEIYVQSKQEQNDGFGLCYFYFNQAIKLYLLGQSEQALESSKLTEQYLAGPAGMLTEVVFYFYDSLIHLACVEGPDDADLLAKVSENQQKMQRWAHNAPMNFQHKYELVCAEEWRILGDRIAAMDAYDRAIAGAQANGYLQEQAIANELAARFYLDLGKEKLAAVYLQEAYLCYDRWGAKAKTDELATRYSVLLQPMLQQSNVLDSLATLHSIAPLNLSVHSVRSSSQPVAGQVNQAFDLATIFKAAQTLSESIDLSELLEKLAPMMLQTSGAERLALLLPNADSCLQVRLMATAETTQLISAPLDSHSLLPAKLLRYVQRTQEIVVLDAEEIALPVVDMYLQQHSHRSVLCAPLLHQRKLVGLLYLEHHSVADVFNRDRITILNFLCIQAAISLENALLNHSLEQKIKAQTKELRESETRLRSMINNIPGVVYQLKISAAGEIDSVGYISPDCYDLYEVTAEAFMGGQHGLRDFEHSEDRPIIDQMLTELIPGAQTFQHEFRIITPSGTLKWIQVFGSSRPQVDGTALWDGVIVDVSDRKQAELALGQEILRRNTIFNTSPDAIHILDFEGNLLEANANFFRGLGYTPEEAKHLTIFDWDAKYTREELQEKNSTPFSEFVATVQDETLHRRKDGSIFPVDISISAMEWHGQISFICIARDISDRKQAESEQKRQLDIFASTSDFIGTADPSGKILYLNEAWQQLLMGEKKTQVSRVNISEQHPDWALEIICDEALPAAARQGMWCGETALLDGKGREIPVSQVVISHHSSEGELEYFSTIIRDISDRKAVEQELILKQNHLEALLDNIPHMAWIKDDKSRFIAANRALADAAGCSTTDITGKNDYDFWPEDMAQVFRDDDSQVLQSGKRKVLEEQISYPDGTLAWLETTKTPFNNADGELAGTVGIAADITNRKNYEQKILEAKAFLQTVLDTFPLSVFWKNRESRYLGANKKFAQDAGFEEAEDIKGLTDFDMAWAKIEAENYRVDDQAVMQSDSPKLGIIETQVRADGTQIWVETNKLPLHDLDGNVIGVMGTYQDISDRKAVELALEQEILRRTSIFNASSDGIHVLDTEGNLLEANASFAKALGYTPEETKRLNVGDWDAKLSRKHILANLQKNFLLPTQLRTIETLYRRKDGSIFPVEISICPMEWHHKISFICISRDISDRKQAEAKLQHTNAELIRATRLKDEFLANMSHELRTPLNSILGLSEILQDEVFGSLSEQQLKYLKTIEHSGNHLLTLINDILDVAKIEAGKLKLNLKATNIGSLCESSLAFVKQQAMNKRISLTTTISSPDLILRIDERRILQSLVNLLNNAVKFTFEGGCVALEVSCHQQDEHRQPFNAQLPSEDTQNPKQWVWESGPLMARNYIKISVTDTGIGIAPEQITKLFKPFSQVDSTLNRKYMGTGLGLVLVKQITDLHGGMVCLTSEVNVGSCFSINLPYEPELSLAEPEQSPADISPLNLSETAQPDETPLILLAEDNESTINMMVPYLEAVGYRLMVAKNGLESIELAQAHHPDLILMDIQMPDVDGIESIQQIRQMPHLKQVPIIALTALAMVGDRERCLMAGASQYLSKPVKLKQLVQNIQKLLVQ